MKKILCLIKIIPDADVENKFVINPYDELALEAALRIKDKNPDVEILCLTLCDAAIAKGLMLNALAMGADRALIISDDKKYFDPHFVAKTLSVAVKKENPDVIFCGKESSDTKDGLVHILLAKYLKWEYSFEQNIFAENKIEGDLENKIFIIDRTTELNEARYVVLAGIMRAKRKPLDVVEIRELEINDEKDSEVFDQFSFSELEREEALPPKSNPKIFKSKPSSELVKDFLSEFSL